MPMEGNQQMQHSAGDRLQGPTRDHGTELIMIEMTSTKNTIVEDGISPTLTARMGTGGNQVNAVLVKRHE